MAAYIILSRFSPEAFRDPKDFKKLAETVSSKIKSDCPLTAGGTPAGAFLRGTRKSRRHGRCQSSDRRAESQR